MCDTNWKDKKFFADAKSSREEAATWIEKTAFQRAISTTQKVITKHCFWNNLILLCSGSTHSFHVGSLCLLFGKLFVSSSGQSSSSKVRPLLTNNTDSWSERILTGVCVCVVASLRSVIKFVQKNQKPQDASKASAEDPEGRYKYPP